MANHQEVPVHIATTDRVPRDELLAFVAERRHLLLETRRRDGRTQISPVVGTIGADGRLLISSYPSRAKVANLQREEACSVVVLSDDFDDAWVQLYGTAEVLDGEAGVETLVAYYRAAAGEHPDWDEYRQAMRDRSKVAIAITIDDWGPIATGGVPPEFA
jgi:PPOX class probable F420-dependent enzyme